MDHFLQVLLNFFQFSLEAYQFLRSLNFFIDFISLFTKEINIALCWSNNRNCEIDVIHFPFILLLLFESNLFLNNETFHLKLKPNKTKIHKNDRDEKKCNRKSWFSSFAREQRVINVVSWVSKNNLVVTIMEPMVTTKLWAYGSPYYLRQIFTFISVLQTIYDDIAWY